MSEQHYEANEAGIPKGDKEREYRRRAFMEKHIEVILYFSSEQCRIDYCTEPRKVNFDD